MAKRRLRRIDPTQAAKVSGILYGLMGLLLAPFFFLFTLVAPEASGAGALGIGFAIAVPLIYAVIGAIGTFIAAAVYNLVAGWVGGIEVEVEDRDS